MAIDIPAALDALVTSEIKILPCHTNRASSIGDECLRKLVYYRTSWQQAKLPDVGLQYIFEEGKDHEEKLIRKILRSGVRLTRLQEPLFDEAHNLSGHPDGFVVDPESGKEYPFDIKSMSPFVFSAVREIEDFKKYFWTRKYVAQIMTYMYIAKKEKGVFILVNKATGRIRQLWVDYDAAFMEELLGKCDEVNMRVANGTLPEKIQGCEDCDYCPFLHLCAPDKVFKAPDFIKDPEMEAQIIKRAQLAGAAKEFKDLDEEIKAKLKLGFGPGNVGKEIQAFVGQQEVKAKWTVKKAYEVKANSYWTIKLPGGDK